MASDQEVVESIFSALKNLQGKSPGEIGQGELPRIISAGPQGSFQITAEIDDSISTLAASLKGARPDIARCVTKEEWRLLAREELGPVLAKTKLSTPASEAAKHILKELTDRLDEKLKRLLDQEYVFGATVFSELEIPSFQIGPIKFEPRHSWLSRKKDDGAVPEIVAKRVERVWAGARRPRSLKDPLSSIREKNIFDAVGPCAYVCSVKLEGFGSRAGLQAAATAARLGLTCIALVFDKSSEALNRLRLRYDGPLFLRHALHYSAGHLSLAGAEVLGSPFGVYIKADDWMNELAARQTFFRTAEEVLDFFLQPTVTSPRPKLVNALLQAMLFFYEGCREEDDQRAVVSFAAVLDALGKGKKTNGILSMLEARLAIKRTDHINARPESPTFENLMDKIYSDGRSRTIHGTSDQIGHDWSEARAQAQTVARLGLYACMDWSAANLGAKDADDLKK